MMNITKSLAIKLNSLNQNIEPKSHILDNKAIARDHQLKEKSQDLEAVFLTQLFKSMEKTIPKNSSGSNQNMATMMFSSVMGQTMAKNNGLGLSEIIYNSLKEQDSHVDTDNLQSNELMNSIYTSSIPKLGMGE